MSQLKSAGLGSWLPLTKFLPLALWATLWLGASPGSLSGILSPTGPADFLQGLSGILPFAAAFAAGVVIIFKLSQRLPRGFQVFSPLTLAAIYGVVGLIAASKSPSGAVALRWAALYLTVPLVLWAIAWGTDPLDQARRILKSTWLVIILVSIALCATALIYLRLTDVILDPSRFLECRGGGWFDLTSGRLRDTGVGRYAAIAAIIAISGLWQARWRPVWAFVLLASIVLLVFSGARGSFAGFAAGAALTVLLYAGRRALFAGALALAVLVPIFWATGAYRTFLDNCIVGTFQGGLPLSASIRNQLSPVQQQQISAQGQILSDSAERSPSSGGQSEASPRQQIIPQASASATSSSDQQLPADSPAPKQTPSQASTSETSSNDQQLPAVPPAPKQTPSQASTSETSSNDQQLPAVPPAPKQTPSQASTAHAPPVGQQPAPAAPSQQQEDLSVSAGKPAALGSGGRLRSFAKFTGRTAVWAEGLKLFRDSPFLGFGFHADRVILGTHMHNAFLHSLLQTGILGTIPFMGALIFGWVLLFRATRKLAQFPLSHKHLVIQSGGILAFLTMRSFPESTGAFFGIDWLVLAPLLLYLHLLNSSLGATDSTAR